MVADPTCCPCPARPGATSRCCTSSATSPPRSPRRTSTWGSTRRLSYFPARAAAFGEAGPGLTVATFYVFAPVAGRGGAARGVGDHHARAGWSQARRDGMAGPLGAAARRARRRRGAGDRPRRVRGADPAGPPAVRRARRPALARGRPARAVARRDAGPRAPRRRPRLGAPDARPRPGRGDRARRAVVRHDPLPPQDPRLVRRGVRRGDRPAARARLARRRRRRSPTRAAPSGSGSRTTPTGSRSRAGPRSGPSGPPGCTSW